MYILTVLEKIKQRIDAKHLRGFYRIFIENDDETNAVKLLDLYEKLTKKELSIGFAGHFSAGKSSMINSLLGKEILPKSPIPTSANIVKITSGEGKARVYFRNDAPVEYNEPYDLDMIKELCKERGTVEKILINTGEQLLPRNCSFVDTPGIDAANDADRLVTESSLHLIDVLFYVMDYNHVQSEVNFHFLKSLEEMNLPFYIIINQMDKHREEEIPFTMYKSQVKQTFEQWNISPVSIYFTSLVDQDLPFNELKRIKAEISKLLHHPNDFSRIDQSIKQVIHAHKKYLNAMFSEKTASVAIDNTVEKDVLAKLEEVNYKINAMEQQAIELSQTFESDLNTTLKNAYVMSADLRDKAALFLESQQKDFKVGFISSKKKTEREKHLRLQEFLSALQKKIETTIQWKLRDKFLALLKKYSITGHNITDEIQQFSIHFTDHEVIDEIKPGAMMNGNYVLQYTNDVNQQIKNKFIREAKKLQLRIQAAFEQQHARKLANYHQQKKNLNDQLAEQEEVNRIHQIKLEKFRNLDEQFTRPDERLETKAIFERGLEQHVNRPIQKQDSVVRPVQKPKTQLNEQERKVVSMQKTNHTTKTVIPLILKTMQTVQNLPGFDRLIEDLKMKKSRLENKNVTIALFGAFSAGKSSFANALIGEPLLPASPNPTTAIISRVVPVKEGYDHGTGVITYKDEQTLLADLRSLTKQADMPNIDSLSEAITWLNDNKDFLQKNVNKTYMSFLLAIIHGYEYSQSDIGKTRRIDLTDFSSFIVDETKACYIEAIDIFYDCSLTRQGITIVDTPGADSVNARHTNVSFDYIKHADAIIYVTYYNHALSRADKDFLLQLGRVKEAFEMDKMFFIINASDLAHSEAELQLVVDYVEEQLVQLGIRFPNIFPLSSKQSLEEKQNHVMLNKKMTTFQKAFFSFIEQGINSLLIESALFDIKRVKKNIASLIKTVSMNEHERKKRRRQLLQEQQEMEQIIYESDTTVYEKQLQQKIEKQLYYMVERIGIRFHDLFKEEFNPTTITESGKNGIEQLQDCMLHLLDYMGYELLQEVRAVSLRVERYMNQLNRDVRQEYNHKLNQIASDVTLPMVSDIDFQTPSYEQAFEHIGVEPFYKVLARFKGPKALFVKNEIETIKEAIYDILHPFMQQYTTSMQSIMENAYLKQWKQLMSDNQQRIAVEVTNYVENNLTIMGDTVDKNDLDKKYQIVLSLIGE